MPNHEEESMVKKYYFNMKISTCGKILIFLLSVRPFEIFFINYFVSRELVNKLLTDVEIVVKKVCWYCKNCKK